MEATLRKLLGLLQAKDTSDIFSEPVDPTEVHLFLLVYFNFFFDNFIFHYVVQN